MSLWRALFKKPNGLYELEPLKQEFSERAGRVQDAARRLARAAETVSKQRREKDTAARIDRFRNSGVF